MGEVSRITRVAERVDAIPGSRHVLVMRNGAPGAGLVTADVGAEAADAALAAVRELGVPSGDVELLRLESIGPATASRPLGGVVWADLLSQAGANARPLARYVALMASSGVIAAFGVIYANQILIVGAMAISPDTLPITATCTALVLGRWGLAGRAFAALAVGLTVAGLIAGAMTFALDALSALPAGFEVGASSLQGLQTVNVSTPIVAFAAWVAGMLALETRASLAVGVAISVTTIPASALPASVPADRGWRRRAEHVRGASVVAARAVVRELEVPHGARRRRVRRREPGLPDRVLQGRAGLQRLGPEHRVRRWHERRNAARRRDGGAVGTAGQEPGPAAPGLRAAAHLRHREAQPRRLPRHHERHERPLRRVLLPDAARLRPRHRVGLADGQHSGRAAQRTRLNTPFPAVGLQAGARANCGAP